MSTWIREQYGDFDASVAYGNDELLQEALLSDIEDVVEEVLDWHYPDPLPETVKVTGYRYMKFDKEPGLDPDNILTDILERLDEEYGDPNGDGTEPTPRMKAAAKALSEAILSDYQPWACEPCGHAVVDVRQWCELFRPEWLEQGA